MNSNYQEKRKFARIPVECRVSFAIGPEDDMKKRIYQTTDVRDLSTEGISFESPKALEPGTFLHTKLDFQSKGISLKIRGSVMRCDLNPRGQGRYIVGVRFFGSARSLAEMFIPCL